MMDKYTSVKQCLDCESKTVVIDSRVKPYGAVWRKRKCTKCGYIFNTLELEECMVDAEDLIEEIKRMRREIKDLKGKIDDARRVLGKGQE